MNWKVAEDLKQLGSAKLGTNSGTTEAAKKRS